MTRMAELVVTILGCGASPGVPRIGNDWGACDPANPRNRRLRASLLVERWTGNDVTRVLIDTGPDLREQMISAGVDWVDGVLYTHPHADHIHGIDDLRAFAINRRRRVHVYMDGETSDRVRGGFDYCFRSPSGSSYPPILEEHRIEAESPIVIEGPGGPIHTMPFTQTHGSINSLGFRFGDLAYSSDLNDIPENSLGYVSDLDTWIVAALRHTTHPSHFSLGETIEWAQRLKVRHTILTHMHVDMDYQNLCDTLPEGIEPGYDGMQVRTAVPSD